MRMVTLAISLLGCSFDPGSGGGASAGVGDSGTAMPADTGPSPTTAASQTTAVDSTGATPGTTAVATTGTETTGAPSETTGSSTSGASEGSTSTASTGEPACIDVLWVRNVGEPTAVDAAFIDRLEAAGFFVSEAQDDLVQAADADGQCAVVIAGSVDSADVGTKLRELDIPVLVIEYNLFDDMGFALDGSYGAADGDDLEILITDERHPLAAGNSGVVKIWDGGGRMSWALPLGADVAAVNAGFITQSVLFEFPVGAALIDGGTAQGLRIALPFMEGGSGTPTDDALEMFEAAIHYATGS